MKMYIRKDPSRRAISLGIMASAPPPLSRRRTLTPANRIPSPSIQGGSSAWPVNQLVAAPARNVAVAPKWQPVRGLIAQPIAIVHLDSTGPVSSTPPPHGQLRQRRGRPGAEGTFNEPWGVAVGPDGNGCMSRTPGTTVSRFHRGWPSSVRMWSSFVVDGLVDVFWVPRGIAVEGPGSRFRHDTGKQRVVVIDSQG